MTSFALIFYSFYLLTYISSIYLKWINSFHCLGLKFVQVHSLDEANLCILHKNFGKKKREKTIKSSLFSHFIKLVNERWKYFDVVEGNTFEHIQII
jgi:hypothetical protein